MTLVAGFHAVGAVLTRTPARVRVVYVLKGRRDHRAGELIELARTAGIRVDFVDRRRLDRISPGSHQGVAADCHDLAPEDEQALEALWPDLASPRLLLVLDGVKDPRNLGACLRSAAAAGVQAVLLPKRRSAPLNEAALKTAAGAAEQLRIFELSNLARRLDWLKQQGLWLVGAAGDAGVPWTGADFSGDVGIVMGGEEKGLRELTRKHCDQLVGIPMADGVDSLNVAVATGVLLFEAVRQRGIASLPEGP